MKWQLLACLLGLVTLLGVPHVAGAAQDEFVLRSSPKEINAIVSCHGLTLLRSLDNQGLFLVGAPATASPQRFLSDVRSDRDVQGIEADTDVMLPEAPPGLRVDQSTASILDTLSHQTLVPFYESPV